MNFAGWFLINIVVPLTLPALGVRPLQARPVPVGRIRLSVIVKGGQLCWAVPAHADLPPRQKNRVSNMSRGSSRFAHAGASCRKMRQGSATSGCVIRKAAGNSSVRLPPPRGSRIAQ